MRFWWKTKHIFSILSVIILATTVYFTCLTFDISTSTRTGILHKFSRKQQNKKQKTKPYFRIGEPYVFNSPSTTVVPTRSCPCFNLSPLWWQLVTTGIRLVVRAASPVMRTHVVYVCADPTVIEWLLPFVDFQIKIHHYTFNSVIHPLFSLFSSCQSKSEIT